MGLWLTTEAKRKGTAFLLNTDVQGGALEPAIRMIKPRMICLTGTVRARDNARRYKVHSFHVRRNGHGGPQELKEAISNMDKPKAGELEKETEFSRDFRQAETEKTIETQESETP